jgi:mRNA interferase RelE/StbE
MTYELAFLEVSLKEWGKLDRNIQAQFKKKLEERLEMPRVQSAKLHGHEDRYKIKFKSIGYRLVYQVKDHELIVLVISVGKRERNSVYKTASIR